MSGIGGVTPGRQTSGLEPDSGISQADAASARPPQNPLAEAARVFVGAFLNDLRANGLERTLKDAMQLVRTGLEQAQREMGAVRRPLAGITSEPGQVSTTENRDAKGRLTDKSSTRTVTREADGRTMGYQTTSSDVYDRTGTASQSLADGRGAFERSGSTAQRHDRGVSLTSRPSDGKSAGEVGDAAHGSVGGGRPIWTRDGRVSADAALYGTEGRTGAAGRYGSVEADYTVRAGEVRAEAGGVVSITSRGAHARGDARVELNILDARGHVGYETPTATVAGVPFGGRVDANVRANVSAEAHATGELIVDPLGGRVYAGGDVGASAVAKIEGDVTGAVQYTDANGERRSIGSIAATGYGSVGAEAAAHARIGFDRGKLSFDLGAGAAWGFGAGGGVSGEVDLRELGRAGLQAADKLTGGALSDVREAISAASGGSGGGALLGAARSVLTSWID